LITAVLALRTIIPKYEEQGTFYKKYLALIPSSSGLSSIHPHWTDLAKLNTLHFRPVSKLRKPTPDFHNHSNTHIDSKSGYAAPPTGKTISL